MSIRRPFFLLFAVLAALPMAGFADQTETVDFRFGREGRYVQTLTVTTEQNLTVDQPRMEKTVSVSDFTLARSASGWTLTVRPMSMELFQDGSNAGYIKQTRVFEYR